MRDLNPSLLEYLEQLDTKKDRIEEAIIGVRRWIATLAEVIDCSVLGAKAQLPLQDSLKTKDSFQCANTEEKLPLEDNSEMWMRSPSVLDEVTSRSAPGEEPKEELPLEDNSEMWMRRLRTV